ASAIPVGLPAGAASSGLRIFGKVLALVLIYLRGNPFLLTADERRTRRRSMKAQGRRPSAVLLVAVLVGTALGPVPARAEMMLTSAGVAGGFTLSTFASGFPNAFGLGPLGIAFPSGGGVLVTAIDGSVRFFPTNADGQSAGGVPVTANYGFAN